MKKTSSNPHSSTDRIRSWARTKSHGTSPLSPCPSRSTLPLSHSSNSVPIPSNPAPQSSNSSSSLRHDTTTGPPAPPTGIRGLARSPSKPTVNNTADSPSPGVPSPAPPPQADGEGPVLDNQEPTKKNVAMRFWLTSKSIILSSYINLLLVFVPVGIAAEAAGLSPGIIFAMNAIAIVPLAGLLSHATESVAKRMGDTIGALMNVTFGNAVELIILYALQLSFGDPADSPSIIALAKGEIRIVQASLLGSILANLLLILGMCFLVGGLRYREQIYNSTVTQMSACLLSLSVMSLLLPILLFVYVLYLLFQLKSHAYMYESTPQHIIDEESAPGPVAQWMETSSDESSSSSGSDSDGSSASNTTAKRFKRVMRGGRRHRKSSAGSKETAERIEPSRTSSFGAGSPAPAENVTDGSQPPGRRPDAVDVGEEGDDEDHDQRSRKNSTIGRVSKKQLKKERKRQEKTDRKRSRINGDTIAAGAGVNEKAPDAEEQNAPRRVDFALVGPEIGEQTDSSSKRPFNLRNITSIRPQIPKTFSQNVFMQPSPILGPTPVAGPIPRVRYGIRRTNSLPDRLNQTVSGSAAPSRIIPTRASSLAVASNKSEADDENISRTTAVFLLLISTGLVAVCAEFMVDSINAVVDGNSGISEAFIGLIILPIVGNAAEHVTAVTVASKNKMDLAIGVAVGSSIQIALFVTPFVVLLGWAMGQPMSLYFTLFETVCLFVSAFIVNFLILDGRSNYLEGALLCAAYVVIAVAAFFYPNPDEQSSLGGADVGKAIVVAARSSMRF
ncbi:hypothetical protein JHW43_009326 [Diplocarpon mali]|nr:hypothetical protein JHW43_009326 [Diplocarpon mali]